MDRIKHIAHYLVGVLIAGGALAHWTLPLIGTALFLVYEIDEDWHLYDQAYKDILEAAIGFFAAVTGLIAWRLLT